LGGIHGTPAEFFRKDGKGVMYHFFSGAAETLFSV
jgi:hypothetical protein